MKDDYSLLNNIDGFLESSYLFVKKHIVFHSFHVFLERMNFREDYFQMLNNVYALIHNFQAF